MKLKNILENFILVAIILVIIHTFLQELGAYLHWSISFRNILIFGGLFFDLLFTIEFAVRSIFSGRRKEILHYWLYERGWVDFLSSVPLLLLDSGPSVFLLLSGNQHAESGIGVLNVLKVVKAVRVTRILRLVRIIKIFGKIHNVESRMAQHHTATISTIAVFTIVSALIVFSVFTDSSGIQKINERKGRYTVLLDSIEKISRDRKISPKKIAREVLRDDTLLLKVYFKEELIIANLTEEEFTGFYTREDYVEIRSASIISLVSIVDIHREIALNHMESFFIIVLVVLSFMIIYTRHFAQNISDIVHILNKGFRKKNYNLQIKIRKEFAQEEIYRLAKFYNDAYLPAKLRQMQYNDDKKSSGISLKDLQDFNK